MPHSIKFKESFMKGVWLYRSEVHLDNRGTTSEWFNSKNAPINFAGITITQLITATSQKDVIRGIHFSSIENPQYKLIKCMQGTILDVVVDLRRDSSTFGKYEMFQLDSTKAETLMVPKGFGHGYQAISDNVIVQYALETNFRFDDEHTINPFDKTLNIPWRGDRHILLNRDRNGKDFNSYFNN